MSILKKSLVVLSFTNLVFFGSTSAFAALTADQVRNLLERVDRSVQEGQLIALSSDGSTGLDEIEKAFGHYISIHKKRFDLENTDLNQLSGPAYSQHFLDLSDTEKQENSRKLSLAKMLVANSNWNSSEEAFARVSELYEPHTELMEISNSEEYCLPGANYSPTELLGNTPLSELENSGIISKKNSPWMKRARKTVRKAIIKPARYAKKAFHKTRQLIGKMHDYTVRQQLARQLKANPKEDQLPASLDWKTVRNKRMSKVHLAARRGDAQTARALINRRKQRASAVVRLKDKDGRTPFHNAVVKAAETNDLRLVKFMIEKGAKVGGTLGASKATALHFAAQNGNLELVQALVEAGANIHAGTTQGFTPLHSAAAGGKLETVKYLLALGANPKTEAQESGQTFIPADMLKSRANQNKISPEIRTEILKALGTENI